MTKTYTILGIVVAVILGVYFALPQKRFAETVFPLSNGEWIDVYDDKADGGDALVESALTDSTLDFSCALGMDSTKGGWCGILFHLADVENKHFRKWNFVDTVYLDVESSGTKEILLKLWTFDPDVTDVKKNKTFRLLLKEVALSGGRQRVAIPMDDFYTPDFWFEEVGEKSARNRRSLESAARLEITSGWNQPRGKKYSLKVREVSVSGISNLYFGIAMGAVILVVMIAIGMRHPRKNGSEN